MRAYASPVMSVPPAATRRGARAGAPTTAAVLRLQRTAGNRAVGRILRQSLGIGPPIMYSPMVRDLVKPPPPPQDLVKDDPMNPASGLPTGELRDARLEQLRKLGPQPLTGDVTDRQADPRWRAMRAAYPEGGLAGRLIEHYATGGGKELTLSKADAVEAAPIINLNVTFSRGGDATKMTNHIGLHREIAALKKAGGGSKHVAFQGTGSAATHGTLGSFTILYEGELRVARPGETFDELGSSWHFKGTAVFYDVYNFESRGDRHPAAEIMTGVGRYGMDGDPFRVVSEPVTVEQTELMLNAVVEGRSANGSGGKASKVAPVLKHVLPDPMKGSGSSGW